MAIKVVGLHVLSNLMQQNIVFHKQVIQRMAKIYISESYKPSIIRCLRNIIIFSDVHSVTESNQ
jgi:hypothetical protein